MAPIGFLLFDQWLREYHRLSRNILGGGHQVGSFWLACGASASTHKGSRVVLIALYMYDGLDIVGALRISWCFSLFSKAAVYEAG